MMKVVKGVVSFFNPLAGVHPEELMNEEEFLKMFAAEEEEEWDDHEY